LSDDTAIYFYHGCNWTDVPARQQYLMAALSRRVPIVFFDGGADSRLRVTIQNPRPNVTVVRGLTARCESFHRRGLDKLAGLYANWRLRDIRRKYKRVIFWSAENWLRPYRFIRHDVVVYDCIDPCFSTNPKRIEIFQQREEKVLADAAHVFATADALADFCRRHNGNVTLLNNACEPADYEQTLLDAAPQPAWWPKTVKPVAAYLGSLDWRFDFGAVESACREHPELHFVLAGNRLRAFDGWGQRLAEMPNVTLPGRISVEDGRFLLSRCAIGLIPFNVGPMNDAVNPVKMYAYALLGKPMAGTNVREMASRMQIVAVANTPQEYAQAVARAMEQSHDATMAANLRKFALDNTWEHRAAQAWGAIQGL
jgi:hypothetical protein